MNRTRSSGYSLLEVLTAILIVSLLLSIAVPRLNSLRLAASFDAAAEDARQFLDRARWRTINSGEFTRVALSGGVLQMIDDDTDAVLASIPLRDFDVTATATNFPVTFRARGFVSGGTPTLRIANAKISATRDLRINPVGRVS